VNEERGVTKRRFGMSEREMMIGYLLLLPGLLGLAVFVVYPVITGVSLAFQSQYLLEPEKNGWVGLANFAKFLFQDQKLGLYIGNTVRWVVGSVIGRITLGMILALLLNRDMPFRGIYRALALIPWVMPGVVAAIVWQWIYNANWGILNHVLKTFGLIQTNIVWLSDRKLIWPAILGVSIWGGYPFSYAFILAGLQVIPHDLYEAAIIDGANRWSSFRHITLPMLRPVLFVLLLLQTVWNANEFTAIWMLTKGGPADYTMTLAPLVYQTSFVFYRVGYGASIAVILSAVVLIFAIIYIRSVRSEI
jgi:multiple sugar transport system permease protein